MAENQNVSQKKMGELFVELGTKGSGKMLGTLNNVSAQFLLTKNAAVQAVKPIVDFTKKTVNSAVNVQKLSVALGTSAIQVQKMQAVLKQYSLSESLLGDIEGLSGKIQQFQEKGIVDENMIFAFNQLGLDINDYNDSLESTLQLIDDVKGKLKGLDIATQRQRLKELGLSQDFLYAFTKLEGGFTNLPNLANAITDEEIEKEVKLKEEFEKTKMEAERAFQKAIVDYMPKFTNAVQSFGEWVSKLPGIKKQIPSLAPKQNDIKTKEALKTIPFQKENVKVEDLSLFKKTYIVGYKIGDKLGEMYKNNNINNKQKASSSPTASSKNNQSNKIALPPALEEVPELDVLGQSNLTNTTINVTQNISTSDPVQAGNISADRIKQAGYNAYQTQNTRGR